MEGKMEGGKKEKQEKDRRKYAGGKGYGMEMGKAYRLGILGK